MKSKQFQSKDLKVCASDLSMSVRDGIDIHHINLKQKSAN